MLDDGSFTAGDLMTQDVAVVHPETSLLEAVTLMARRRISGLPVVDQAGTLLGMITEGDLVRWHEGYTERQTRWLNLLAEGTDLAPAFVQAIRSEHNKVKAAMSARIITTEEDTPARDVAHLMHTKGIKRVPVLRDGRLVGIIARSDLVRALAEKLKEMSAEEMEMPHTVDEALRRRRNEAG